MIIRKIIAGLASVLCFADVALAEAETRNSGEQLFDILDRAGKGEADGMFKLGMVYLGSGYGEAYDAYAIELLTKAADQGHAQAQAMLAAAYLEGDYGLEKNESKAVELLELSAAQGCGRSQEVLGMMFYMGWVRPRDRKKAVAWLEKAAAQGSVCALGYLGDAYMHGRGGLRADSKKADECFSIISEKGSANDLYFQAEMYSEGLNVVRDVPRALEWYKMAAARGCDEALPKIGNIYFYGQAGRADAKEAAIWYEKALEKGVQGPYIYTLGLLYMQGRGVETDMARAVHFFRKGGEMGEVHCLHQLATLHSMGVGVPLDEDKARALYEQAGGKGMAEAYFDLGMLHVRAGDSATGLRWIQQAADAGMEKAQQFMRASKQKR